MNSKLVSLVIPAYNAEDSIGDLLDCLIVQTYGDIEILVINDGSTDGTSEIVRSYLERDGRIKLFDLNNGGVSRARNIGISKAVGRYLLFADADDVLEENYVATLITAMGPRVDLACCGYKVRTKDGRELLSQHLKAGVWAPGSQTEVFREMLGHKAFNVLWNKAFRTEIIERRGIVMDESLSMGEDLLFVTAYCDNLEGGIALVDSEPYSYTMSKSGLQASANTNGRLEASLYQLNKLREMLEKRGVSRDVYDQELLSGIYTALVLSEDVSSDLERVQASPQFKNLSEISSRSLGAKYRVFLGLLKLRKPLFLTAAIKLFRALKKAGGEAYDWA